MKTLHKFKHLAALAAVIMLAFAGAMFHVLQPLTAVCIIICWQLACLALSPRSILCLFPALSAEQIEEFEGIMRSIGGFEKDIKEMPERFKKLEKENDELRSQLKTVRRSLGGSVGNSGVRWIGNKPFVTDDCANSLTGTVVLGLSKIENGLERMIPDRSARQRIVDHAKAVAGIEQRAALDGTSTPLPTIYAPQIIELVFKYGQARQFATVFPLGAGTVKLPRLKAGEDDFGYVGIGTAGMSQSVQEKKVSAELVTFTANKAGGMIRIPSEIEEDTFIPIGQFLARYISRQLAKLEDKTMFLGDGTSTYADITGVGPYCAANNTYLQQLAATKTKPTDATLNDFRALRGKVNPAVYENMPAYYMNPTMEALLVTFNTIGSPLIYRPASGGQPATLDGFPIHWCGVMQPYSTLAAASAFLAFFGDLSYWYLGERGAPRVEVSREVFFATDEIAMRALERIDVEALAIDAMTALQTAAA